MSEKSIQSEIHAKLASRPDIRLFRNNIGMAYQGRVVSKSENVIVIEQYRHIKYGLQNPGGHDLIGWKSITITPEMVGKKIAVFASVECKNGKSGKPSDEQTAFQNAVIHFGGISGLARSLQDAEKIFE